MCLCLCFFILVPFFHPFCEGRDGSQHEDGPGLRGLRPFPHQRWSGKVFVEAGGVQHEDPVADLGRGAVFFCEEEGQAELRAAFIFDPSYSRMKKTAAAAEAAAETQ